MAYGAAPADAVEQPGDAVVAWGNNWSGQSTVPPGLRNAKAISAGESHSLALKFGTVVAWGNNWFGQSTVPPAAQSNVRAIDAGGFHSLALKDDGSVVAWGDNSQGQSTVPEALAGVKAISAGYEHSLAIRDVPPKVTSVLPAEDAASIAPGANVVASFSEAMNTERINPRTVKIFEEGSTEAIPATVTYHSGLAKKALLDPSDLLQRGQSYRVVVTTWAKDEAGNRLDQDQDPSNGYQMKKWFFTVRN